MDVDPAYVRDAAVDVFDGGGDEMAQGSPLVSAASEIPEGFSLADILDGGGKDSNLNFPPKVAVDADMVADTAADDYLDGDDDGLSCLLRAKGLRWPSTATFRNFEKPKRRFRVMLSGSWQCRRVKYSS